MSHDEDNEKPDAQVTKLRSEIDQTRASMSTTLAALEQRLQPSELKGKASSGLEQIEAHVKGAVKEEMQEIRTLLKEELGDAKTAVNEILMNAKDAIRYDVDEIRAGAKQDITDILEVVKKDILEIKDSTKKDVLEVTDSLKSDVLEVKDSLKSDVQEGFKAAHDATIGRLENLARKAGNAMTTTRVTLVETVRQNPIPAAMIGVGIAWLIFNRSATRTRRLELGEANRELGQGGVRVDNRIVAKVKDVGGSLRQSVGGAVSSATHSVGDAVSSATHTMGDAMGKAGQSVGGVVSSATHSVGGALSAAGQAVMNAEHKVVDMAGQATSAAGNAIKQAAQATGAGIGQAANATSQFAQDMGHSAGSAMTHAGQAMVGVAREVPKQAMRVERAAESMYKDNPLAVGAAVLATGVIVGLALPRTRREDQLLGETRDHLIENARDMVKDYAHQAVEAAHGIGEDAAKGLKGTLSQATA